MYMMLSNEDAADHNQSVEELLKNSDMIGRDFRKKFGYNGPEIYETFIQFSSGLCTYFNK